MRIKSIQCFVRLSFAHACKDINLIFFKGFVIFLDFMDIVLYNWFCPFMINCAWLLMDFVIFVIILMLLAYGLWIQGRGCGVKNCLNTRFINKITWPIQRPFYKWRAQSIKLMARSKRTNELSIIQSRTMSVCLSVCL